MILVKFFVPHLLDVAASDVGKQLNRDLAPAGQGNVRVVDVARNDDYPCVLALVQWVDDVVRPDDAGRAGSGDPVRAG